MTSGTEIIVSIKPTDETKTGCYWLDPTGSFIRPGSGSTIIAGQAFGAYSYVIADTYDIKIAKEGDYGYVHLYIDGKKSELSSVKVKKGTEYTAKINEINEGEVTFNIDDGRPAKIEGRISELTVRSRFMGWYMAFSDEKLIPMAQFPKTTKTGTFTGNAKVVGGFSQFANVTLATSDEKLGTIDPSGELEIPCNSTFHSEDNKLIIHNEKFSYTVTSIATAKERAVYKKWADKEGKTSGNIGEDPVTITASFAETVKVTANLDKGSLSKTGAPTGWKKITSFSEVSDISDLFSMITNGDRYYKYFEKNTEKSKASGEWKNYKPVLEGYDFNS